MTPVSTFGNGTRYEAGPYHVVALSGTCRMMLDYSDMQGLDAAIMSIRPDVACSYEETVSEFKCRGGSEVTAATNCFFDPSWRLVALPDESTTRYANLLRLAEENKGLIDAEQTADIRDVQYSDGGASFEHFVFGADGITNSTDYEVVFIPGTHTLWMKVVDKDWQKVELGPLFAA